jgi:hypothetical protein
MVRLALRLFTLLLLTSPLLVGCGDNDKSTRDANASDTVITADTGIKPDLAGDGKATPDTTPALPDASADQASPDATPAKPDGIVDAPAPTGDGGPVTADAPADRAGDGGGDGGSAVEAGSTDTMND